MRQVHVEGVFPRLEDQSPVLVLMTDDHTRALLIASGPAETLAILTHLHRIAMPRPKTHDLFASVLGAMDDVVLTHVAVTDAQDGVYYATMTFVLGGTATRDIDARPSDAIALALRLDAPIFVDDEILQRYGISEGELDEWMQRSAASAGSIDDQMEAFREFLDDVDPEDFSDDSPED